MADNCPYNIQDFGPSDLMTNELINLRRLKVSSEDSSIASALDGFRYSISGTASVQQGNKLALNISLASDAVIKSASTNVGLPISINNQNSNGAADGIFQAHNLNLLSVDVTPSQGQLYEVAVAQGQELVSGIGSLEAGIISGYQKNVSVIVENTEALQDVKITVIFEEIGAREPVFGLTASTQLEPNTEISIYG